MDELLEQLKKVAKSYSDLLDLKTPLGAGTQGQRSTLGDSLAILASGLTTALGAIYSTKLPGKLYGVNPQAGDLLLAGFLVLLAWLLFTYVLVAARDFQRFCVLAPLNLNLVLVWFFIALFVVIVVSYGLGQPGNRATQSLVACAIVAFAVIVHVVFANTISPPTRILYTLALLLSIIVFMDRMYGYEEHLQMLKEWYTFAESLRS